MAILSRTLGEIDVNVPLDDTLENLKVEEWDKSKVLELFKEWNFKRYIEKFNLEGAEIERKEEKQDLTNLFRINDDISIKEVKEILENQKRLIFYLSKTKDDNQENIIKEAIAAISIYNSQTNEVYYIRKENEEFDAFLKDIFENEKIEKIGFELGNVYILLKQIGITMKNLKSDITVASYILDPTVGKYPIDGLIEKYLEISINEYLEENGVNKQEQITLFESSEKEVDMALYKSSFYAYAIARLSETFKEKLKDIEGIDLFNQIDMPTVEVLADMQWNGMHVEENELTEFGKILKDGLEVLTEEIYQIAGMKFNINSPKQLGEVLFEKMGLPVKKKTKSGYSTAEDVLEKLRSYSPIIEKILDYRQLSKLNSTYVEGLKPYINPKTKRIHSFFHQTITATGRISSTEPNLQNIPTRIEFGKRLRKVFKPAEGKVYIDADYSQIELRVLAHMSEDKHMIEAFENGEDIHRQAAAKVRHKPQTELTKEE